MKKTLIATVVASFAALPATAAETTLKFGHVGAPGSLFEATVNNYAACVADKSGGSIEVQTFGSSQLGKDKELCRSSSWGRSISRCPRR